MSAADGPTTEGSGLPAENPAGHTHPEEAWVPELPPLRAIVPSALGGAVVPLVVYYVLRSHVPSDADALAIAGVPAALWVALQFALRRRIDAIGAIVLAGFVLGLSVSFALGGNAFVLKVRDSAFTFVFGVASLVSSRFGRRPLTFYVGRQLSAGTDRQRSALFDRLFEMPPARASFLIVNVVWSVGLIFDAATRVVLAADLSTGAFLAASPAVSGAYVGAMSLATIWIVGRTRRRVPLVQAVAPEGGSTWWWARVLLGASRPAEAPRGGPPAGPGVGGVA